MKKSLIIPVLSIGTLAIVGAVMFGSLKATASSNHDTLVDRIASKFNVPKDQVQTVFDEEHTARQAERQTEQNAKLDQAVKDGVITVEQKDKLIAKRSEMKGEQQKNRDEMQKWLADNGIDHDKLATYMGGKGMRDKGGHRPPMDSN